MNQTITPEEKVEFAVKVLGSLVTTHQAKLERGMMLRQKMHDVIQRGEKPTGYRVDWLRASALEVIGKLADIAQKFNDSYDDDQASTMDLMDVLTTALGLLKMRSGIK